MTTTTSSSSVLSLPPPSSSSSPFLVTGTTDGDDLQHLNHYNHQQHQSHHYSPPSPTPASIHRYYDRSDCYVSSVSTVVPNQHHHPAGADRRTIENKRSDCYPPYDYPKATHSLLHDASDQSNHGYGVRKRKKRCNPMEHIGGEDDNNDEHDYDADQMTREQYVKYRKSEHEDYYKDNNNNNNKSKNNDDSNNKSSSSSIRIGRLKIQN